MKLNFNAKSIFIKTVLIILATGFVLSGVLNFFAGVGDNNIFRIGSKRVSSQFFLKYLNDKRNQYINSDLTEQELDYINSKKFILEVLQETIDNYLFENEIEKLSLRQSKESVFFDIVNSKQFEGIDKKFNKRKFEEFLKQNKIEEDIYIQYFSNFNTQNNFLELISVKDLVNDFVFKDLLKYNNRHIVADITLIYPETDLNLKINDIEEREVKDYYNTNKELFFKSEEKIISYIDFDFNNLSLEEKKNKISKLEDFVLLAKDMDEVSRVYKKNKKNIIYTNDISVFSKNFKEEILTYDVGTFSELIDEKNNIYRLYYIEKINPSKYLSYEESKNEIKEIIKNIQKDNNNKTMLEKIEKQIRNNGVYKTALRNGLKIIKDKKIKKNNSEYPNFFINELYKLTKIGDYTKPIYDEDKKIYYIAEIKENIFLTKNDKDYITEENMKNNFNKLYSLSLSKIYRDYLSTTEKLKINIETLENIYNSYTNN